MASWFARLLAWTLPMALVLLVSVTWPPHADQRESERWFIPGPLGYEPAAVRSGNAGASGSVSGNPDRPPSGDASRAFLTRVFSGLRGSEGQKWGERNGLGGRLPFSHNLTRVFPPELFETHPEFFPLENGRRIQPPKGSYFWNPDIARADVAVFAAEAARKHFTENLDAVSFALGVNDALIWGESPELLALATPTRWFRERPDYSDVVFTFMNRAAGELSRTHPDKYVGALAYYWCENVPEFPLHPQVIPFLTADRSQGYDADFWREELQLQMNWGAGSRGQGAAGGKGQAAGGTRNAEGGSRKTEDRGRKSEDGGQTAKADGRMAERRLGVYDYSYGGGFLIPRVHTELLAEHLRHARRAGFTDYFAEVNPNWGLDGITPWLTAQLLQDPEQSRGALLDEYYRRYFREAAEPMRRFYERCEEQWMGQPGPAYWLKHYRNESQAIVFPSGVCRELRAILDEALAGARSARVRERVRLVSDAFGVTERYVAFYEARDRVLRVVLTAEWKDGEQVKNEIAESLARYLEARREFIRYTHSLQKAQPLALHPFGWDDYLKNDPVAAALMALRDLGAEALDPLIANDPLAARLWPEIEDRMRAGRGKELLRNPAMTGALAPGRTIAGLAYGVSLPPEWQSRVEPSQYFRGELIEADGSRVLRIERTKETTVSQWTRPDGDGVHHAAIEVRGRVSPGTAVSLMFAWLNEDNRHVGFKAVRLPEGDWPEWVTLRQAGRPPAGAVWVGMGIRVQHQVEGDWVEAKGFSLEISKE